MGIDLRKDEKAFEKHIGELFTAIGVLLQNKHRVPSLILIYSLIDILAWLARPRSKESSDVNREHFMKWVDLYLIPTSTFKFTSVDLYSARCSIVHSYNPKSSLTRNKKAKEIYYAWGVANYKHLELGIQRGNHNAVALNIDIFVDDLKTALSEFKSDINSNNSLKKLVYGRASRYFFKTISVNAGLA